MRGLINTTKQFNEMAVLQRCPYITAYLSLRFKCQRTFTYPFSSKRHSESVSALLGFGCGAVSWSTDQSVLGIPTIVSFGPRSEYRTCFCYSRPKIEP